MDDFLRYVMDCAKKRNFFFLFWRQLWSIDVTTYRTRTHTHTFILFHKYRISFLVNIFFFCRWVSGNYSNSFPCCFLISGRTRDQNGDHNFWCLSSSCLVSQSTFFFKIQIDFLGGGEISNVQRTQQKIKYPQKSWAKFFSDQIFWFVSKLKCTRYNK